MIHRDFEESLDLRGMQIERENAMGAGGLHEARDELGRDRHARAILTVLPGVTVIGDHGSDALGRCALESVHHQQQFHQVTVHW